jgi:hypothetical protein
MAIKTSTGDILPTIAATGTDLNDVANTLLTGATVQNSNFLFTVLMD